jgi:hypothetical protein
MVRRVAEEETDTGAVGPFVLVGVLSLEGSLENIYGTAEGVEVEEVGVDVGARKARDGRMRVGGGLEATAVFLGRSEVGW